MAFWFEGLEIFHAAIDFSAGVYEAVKKFPAEERFDLASQAPCCQFYRSEHRRGLGKGNKEGFFSLLRHGSRLDL